MDETDRHKHTDRHTHTDRHPAELTGTEARQASRRPMTVRVLVFGLVLLALAALVLWLAF